MDDTWQASLHRLKASSVALVILIWCLLLVNNVLVLTGFSFQDLLLGLSVLKFPNAVSSVDVIPLFHLHRASQSESLNPSSAMGGVSNLILGTPGQSILTFFP